MRSPIRATLRRNLMAGIAAAALLLAGPAILTDAPGPPFAGPALAAEGGHSGGGGRGGGGGHDTDEHHDEHSGDSTHSSGGQSGGGRGGGRLEDRVFRGEGPHEGGGREGVEDRVLRGGRGGGAGGGSGGDGGSPVWAQEGVPEDVELGRMNVARSPTGALQNALDEVYAHTLDKNGDGVLDADADIDTIDSPHANLALFGEAIHGDRQVEGAWSLDDAARFLGKATEMTNPVEPETVQALLLIMELEDEVDLASFSYNRSQAHPAEIATIFDGKNYTGSGLEAFAQAADDARAIRAATHEGTHEEPATH